MIRISNLTQEDEEEIDANSASKSDLHLSADNNSNWLAQLLKIHKKTGKNRSKRHISQQPVEF